MLIDDADYREWDAVHMGRMVRSGEVSRGDLAETARSIVRRLSPLNAVADLASSLPGGPPAVAASSAGPQLSGAPFAVKELLAWPGVPWTMGSRMMAANPPPPLTPYAAKILGTGLNVLCTTTSSEFGLLGSTESLLRGATLNPWGRGLSSGGSSGGSAALVAAGAVPMAHGNDAGGSLRVPASLTGLFGFMPSRGRGAATGLDGPGLAALVVEHCITRSVRDSAHFLALTERAGSGAALPPIGLVSSPSRRRLRIAVLRQTLTGREPDPADARELDRCAQLCDSLGHHLEVIDAPPVDGKAVSLGFFGSAALTMAQVSAMMAPALGRVPGLAELEPFTLELIDWAATLGPAAQAQAKAEARLAAGAAAYLTVFERQDVVLSPTLAVPPWPMGLLSPRLGREQLIDRTERLVGYTPIHNAAGCPAMSVPLGQNDGLPVGMHFAERPGADKLLVRLAFELEAAAPWAQTRPDTAWLEHAR